MNVLFFSLTADDVIMPCNTGKKLKRNIKKGKQKSQFKFRHLLIDKRTEGQQMNIGAKGRKRRGKKCEGNVWERKVYADN